MIDADVKARFIIDETIINALVGADYLVHTANPTLTAERVVTDTPRIAWDWTTAGQAKADLAGGPFDPGGVVFIGVAGDFKTDKDHFWWDRTNFRLGIGTGASATTQALTVNDKGNDRQFRIGNLDAAIDGSFAYDLGRDSGGAFSLYGHQHSFVQYVFTGVDGEFARINSTGVHALNYYGPYTAGGVLFSGAGGVVTETDANFHYDYLNARLHIGGNSPTRRLELTDSANRQIRVGSGGTAVYDVGRDTSGFYSAYGWQTGFVNYQWGGVDGTYFTLQSTGATFNNIQSLTAIDPGDKVLFQDISDSNLTKAITVTNFVGTIIPFADIGVYGKTSLTEHPDTTNQPIAVSASDKVWKAIKHSRYLYEWGNDWAAALSELGTTNIVELKVTQDTTTPAGTTTVPANVCVQVEGAGKITTGSGRTITFATQPRLPNRRVFYGSGNAYVLDPTNLRLIWWLDPTPAANNRAAMQQAIASCFWPGVVGGRIIVPAGKWYISGIDLYQNIEIEGMGAGLDEINIGLEGSTLELIAGDTYIFRVHAAAGTTAFKHYIRVKNICLDAYEANAYCVYQDGDTSPGSHSPSSYHIIWENVRFAGIPQGGSSFRDNPSFRQILFNVNGDVGAPDHLGWETIANTFRNCSFSGANKGECIRILTENSSFHFDNCKWAIGKAITSFGVTGDVATEGASGSIGINAIRGGWITITNPYFAGFTFNGYNLPKTLERTQLIKLEPPDQWAHDDVHCKMTILGTYRLVQNDLGRLAIFISGDSNFIGAYVTKILSPTTALLSWHPTTGVIGDGIQNPSAYAAYASVTCQMYRFTEDLGIGGTAIRCYGNFNEITITGGADEGCARSFDIGAGQYFGRFNIIGYTPQGRCNLSSSVSFDAENCKMPSLFFHNLCDVYNVGTVPIVTGRNNYWQMASAYQAVSADYAEPWGLRNGAERTAVLQDDFEYIDNYDHARQPTFPAARIPGIGQRIPYLAEESMRIRRMAVNTFGGSLGVSGGDLPSLQLSFDPAWPYADAGATRFVPLLEIGPKESTDNMADALAKSYRLSYNAANDYCWFYSSNVPTTSRSYGFDADLYAPNYVPQVKTDLASFGSTNQNNLDLGSTKRVVWMSSSAAVNLTGVQNTYKAPLNGQRYELWNRGGFNITLKHNTTSSIGNRFNSISGGDIILEPGKVAFIEYDVANTRWDLWPAYFGIAGTGVTTTFTAGSIPFAGSSGTLTEDNADLFWDNANRRHGFRTNTPATIVDINDEGGTRQIRIGNSGAGSSFTYNFGRDSSGFMSFYGNQTGFVKYIFTGVDGEWGRFDSTGLTAVNFSGSSSGTNTGDETAARVGVLINGAGAATPSDSDLFAMAASSVLKKLTGTNLKAYLKTYFDTVYTNLVAWTQGAVPFGAIGGGALTQSATTFYYDPTTRNLGLETNNPGLRFTVYDSSAKQIRVGSSSSASYDFGRHTDGYFYFYGNQTTFVKYIFTGVDGEWARFDSTGLTAVNFSGSHSGTSSGTNTGDATNAGENYITRSGQVFTANPINLAGSNVTGLLPFAHLANVAAASVLGNTTGSAAAAAAVPMLSTSTANSVLFRDNNANAFANNFLSDSTRTATASGTTTLTVASPRRQIFTGSSAQNCRLPAVSGLALGHEFEIENLSTGSVTVQAAAPASITASQSGTTVTASVGSFASTDVGATITFNDGTQRVITGYTDATHVTVLQTGTVGSQSATINYNVVVLRSNSKVRVRSNATSSTGTGVWDSDIKALFYSFGFQTGAGDSVLQATNRGTDVICNKPMGFILTTNESLANNTYQSFKVFNSQLGANDGVHLWVQQDLQSDATTVVDSIVEYDMVRIEPNSGNPYFVIRYKNESGAADTNYHRFGFQIIPGTNA